MSFNIGILQSTILIILLHITSIVQAGPDEILTTLDTTLITVEAVNLSEDMSTLSSKNDELLMLIYDFSDSTKLLKPLALEYFVLDSAHRIKQFLLKTDKVRNILMLLIEVDTKKTPAVIEKNVRLHYREILAFFRQRDRGGLFKILDDEDLMGYRIIPDFDGSLNQDFSFQGRYNLDRFHYRIGVSK